MTAAEVRALVDDEIRAATRVAGEPVIWGPAYEPFLLAEPEERHPGFWLVFGPAYHADFDFYQVIFDEERRAFGLVFRGLLIGYRRGFIHALEGMPRIRERIGATITCPVCWEERPSKGAIGPPSIARTFISRSPSHFAKWRAPHTTSLGHSLECDVV